MIRAWIRAVIRAWNAHGITLFLLIVAAGRALVSKLPLHDVLKGEISATSVLSRCASPLGRACECFIRCMSRDGDHHNGSAC